MKSGLMKLTVVGMVAALACAAVAQDKPVKHDAAAVKPAERTVWHGTLAVPPAGAAEGVIAVLTSKHHDVTTTLSLKVADATLAATVKELAGKAATVVVKGKLSADETTVDVTGCEAAKPREHAPKAGAERK